MLQNHNIFYNGSLGIGNIEIKQVRLEQGMGFYRICFDTEIILETDEHIGNKGLVIQNASVEVKLEQNTRSLGLALPLKPVYLPLKPVYLPLKPVYLSCSENRFICRDNFIFAIELERQRIDVLDSSRSGEGDIAFDLTFNLLFLETNNNSKPFCLVRPIIHRVPQSEWVKIINACDYKETLLIEVGILKDSVAFCEAFKYLKEARASLLSLKDRETVANCRLVLENFPDEMTSSKHKDETKDLTKTKDERIADICRALKNLTNLSHHANNDAARDADWNRNDARMVIETTASLFKWLENKNN
ncbi:MAG: hypothetical protein DDT40_01944 [candidate division WS2 bacterium]|nr:hypothetical protein [Candidatus Psychracetigena formicireducens]